MRRQILTPILLFLFFGSSPLQPQKLPAEMRISTDGRMLLTGSEISSGLYEPSRIRSIFLEFTQPNFWQLLQQNYFTHRDLPATMIVDGKRYDSVGVRFRGQTSYQQTQNSEKKSFNISVDYIHEKQDLMGYRTLNLNNAFLDRSFMRELFYQSRIRKHIPAARSNFIHLFLNGADWGVYPNVQQLNKDFLREWFLSNDGTNWRADAPPGGGGGMPRWGDGTAALNYLGEDTAQYQKYYTLKSSDQPFPWNDLVAVCDALNRTPSQDLLSVLPTYLDVDRTLWYLASEIAFSDDDSYVFKGKMDYYIYFEPETGRLTPLEYDGNSVMTQRNSNWSPFYNEAKVNYPLLNRILAVPQWRQRYLAHLRTVIEEELDVEDCFRVIDQTAALIDTLVASDPKKLYSYQQFRNEIPVLKNFISTRRNFLLSNPEVAQVAPVVHDVKMLNSSREEWQTPSALEEAIIRTRVTSATGIHEVNLYYSNHILGNFSVTPMFDDGLHDDEDPGDGVFAARIPGYAAGTLVRFYIEAIAANMSHTARYSPPGAEHNVFLYIVAPVASTQTAVVINELMASNSTTAKDEADQYDDWIELYNRSGESVDIGGYFLTDNPSNLDKWMIPDGTRIQPDEYLILWADEDSSQGPYHCNFKLSADGEMVWLLDPSGAMVDSISFPKQQTDMGYARYPNGNGTFRIQSPTFSANNNSVVTVGRVGVPPTTFTAYPNPARHRFILEYTLPTRRVLTIVLSDLLGRTVQTYVSAEERPAGVNREYFTLDADIPPGLYFVRGTTGEAQFHIPIFTVR